MVDQLITDGHTERGVVLQRAKSLAVASTHTFSKAIGQFADQEMTTRQTGAATGGADNAAGPMRTLPGLGLVAHAGVANGCSMDLTENGPKASEPIYLGSIRLLDEAGLKAPDTLQQVIQATSESGVSIVVIGWQGRLRGLFLLHESIRPETRLALTACRQLGLQPTLLTGDHRGRAARIEAELEIPVTAEQLPIDKVTAIGQLRDQHGPVVMVGDGINDAPALAASDVGVAMGCGADLTRESAAVCLLSDDLLRFPWAVALARRGMRTIRQNLFWAFAYNIVGIALAATGPVESGLGCHRHGWQQLGRHCQFIAIGPLC